MHAKSEPTDRARETIPEEVRQVIQLAHRELHQLLEQRAEIANRMCTIKKVVAGLASVFGDQVVSEDLARLLYREPDGDDLLLTRICRSVLSESHTPPSAEEIYAEVTRRSPRAIRQYKDLYVAVRRVLEHLSRSGVARPVMCDGGQTTWHLLAQTTKEGAPRQETEGKSFSRPRELIDGL